MNHAVARTPRFITVAALATGLVVAGAARASHRKGLPHPPRAAWTAAGVTVATEASSFCWNGPPDAAGIRESLCADGSGPSCGPGSRTGATTLRVPANRRVAVRVVLGFRPKDVVITLTSASGETRRLQPPARRGITFRVPASFLGTIIIFAPVRDAHIGGDAVYELCLARRAAR